jgi:hypothetical protein
MRGKLLFVLFLLYNTIFANESVTLKLHRGWNLISNPFGKEIEAKAFGDFISIYV